MISIIAIIAKNRAIGWQNKLLYNIPEDLKHFQAITTGHVVIMGENTFHSLNDRPLPNRVNIILTKNKNFEAKNCLIAHSIDEAIKLADRSALDATEVASKALLLNQGEIFFIGGGQVYAQALPLANKLYLTVVDDEPAQADTFFPDYGEFKHVISREEREHQGLKYSFLEITKG
ncbi:MAG: dihydrofolate reductase [bacterium]|nr:dihydrofolate reductase [bacterium]